MNETEKSIFISEHHGLKIGTFLSEQDYAGILCTEPTSEKSLHKRGVFCISIPELRINFLKYILKKITISC